MWPYVLILLLTFSVSVLKFKGDSMGTRLRRSMSISWLSGLVAVMVLFIGLRYQVGADWITYFNYLDSMQGVSLSEVITLNEPGYLFFNWLGANIGGGIYTVNILSALFLLLGLQALCREQPRPLLAFLVAMPYLLVVVGMGYTRQSVAIGGVMLGMAALYKGNVLRYVLWVLVALLFHKTAVVMLPLVFFALKRHKFLLGSFILLGGMGLGYLLWPHAIYFLSIYVESEYESAGAALRLWMTVLSAVAFMVAHRRFEVSPVIKPFWMALALSSLCLMTLLWAFPGNSTAIDRLALYWIPLQIMVLSHLPGVWVIKGLGRLWGTFMVATYSVVLTLVWLLFADHAHAWLPYRIYQWV